MAIKSAPQSILRWGVGTFSVAGCSPFAGLVVDDKVLAIHALNDAGGVNGKRIYGAESVLTLLQDWSNNRKLLSDAVASIWSGAKDQALAVLADKTVPVSQLHVHAPVEQPGQILMARANYRKHIIELSVRMGRGKGDTEEERRADMERMVDKKAREGDPFFWVKTQCAVTGPFDDIEIPAATEKADWELELAVIIGKPARNIAKEDALDYVAGYCIANDLSARDLLVRDEFGPAQDWLSAKCPAQFMPMGPYLLPTEFIEDPNNLQLTLEHNGKVMQNDSTRDMIHDVQTLIAYAASVVPLSPGDVISTGSPSGNGMEFGIFLQDGDVVESRIEGNGMGVQRNRFYRA